MSEISNVKLQQAIGRPKAPASHRRKDRLWPSFIIIALFILCAVVGPFLLQYDAVSTSTGDRLLPPGSVLSNGTTAILGTDQLGRDMLGQVIVGSRVTLAIAAATIVIAATIGITLGLIAGYFGKAVDAVIMRIADLQLAFPGLLLAILIAGVLGPSIRNVIISLAITRWVTFARLARSMALSMRELDYVSAAQLIGVPHRRILTRYLLPGAIPTLSVLATVEVGSVVLSAAALSFLGLGVPLDVVDWGATIANGRNYLLTAWWIGAMPGIALSTLVLSVSVFGDRLQARMSDEISR
jgi:peptide/nickel transport system permease protein